MSAIFFTSFAVAFSGAVVPGPLLTYTVKQSLHAGPRSGFIIIAGHAIVEIILIALIFMGFDIILQSSGAQIGIGMVGGLLLLYMGFDMIWGSAQNRIRIEINSEKPNHSNMLLSGMVISTANPYFIIWWAFIGLGFLLQAHKMFGMAGVAIFFIGHIAADFIWYGLVSTVVGTTRRFIQDNLYRIIIAVLGGMLAFFGASFVYNAITLLTGTMS